VRVADVMTPDVVTVAADAPPPEAAALLVRHGVAALPVLDGEGALIGMVAEGDLLASSAGRTCSGWPPPRSEPVPACSLLTR
jgi:CBS domain-containing protein